MMLSVISKYKTDSETHVNHLFSLLKKKKKNSPSIPATVGEAPKSRAYGRIRGMIMLTPNKSCKRKQPSTCILLMTQALCANMLLLLCGLQVNHGSLSS